MDERQRLSGLRRHPRLRAYLAALVLVSILASVGGAVYVHGRSVDDARAQALSQAATAARSAARLLGDELASVRPALAGLASSPSIASRARGGPAGCTLSFTIGEAGSGHLDLLRPNGSVACSSLSSRLAVGYRGQPWLARAMSGQLTLAPVADPRTGAPAAVLTEPLRGGIAAAFVDLRSLGPALASELAVPRFVSYVVTTADGRELLARSGPAGARLGGSIARTAFYRDRGAPERPGPSGTRRLFARSTVAGLHWVVYAGIDSSVALAAASRLYHDYLLVIAGALLLMLVATAVVERLIAAPIVALGAAMRRGPAGAASLSERGPLEIAALSRSFRGLSADIERRLDELGEAREAAREAEREASETAAAYRMLFEENPQPLWIYDERTLEIFEVNLAAVEAYGYSRDEFLSMTLVDLRPAEEEQALRRQLAAADRGRDRSGPWRHLKRDGTPIAVEIVSHPVDFRGRRGRLVMATDVTERERLQRRLAQVQRLESLGQLAGGVAHDFNNLLSVIVNYAAFVEERLAEAATVDDRWSPVRDDVVQVVEAAGRAGRLTRQLLAFARREVMVPEVVDVNAIVRRSEELLRRTLGEHIRLTLLLGEDVPAVMADPGKLEQVLLNLAVNARDAMPDGGTLVIETANVEVDESADPTDTSPGPHARLRVSDTGEGMDRETIERAFEPFFTTKAEGAGTGLGLATVYGVVTQVGGSVRLYSEPGIGTTCTVMLPSTDHGPSAPPPEEDVATVGAGATVLIVEDEDGIREVARRILSRHGFNVLVCADGAAALDLARAHDGPIDLLIADVIMPEMMGREVAERFRSIRPGARVVFMSGYAAPVLGSRRTLPADTILLGKPFTERELLAKVGAAMAGHAPATIAERSTER